MISNTLKRRKSNYNGISIIIITRNRYDLLRKCIFSLQAQDFKGKYELIVVDGSDRSEIIKYTSVRQIFDTVPGFGRARNLGVRAAKYELIAFIDDDCVAHKSWLSELYNCIIKGYDGAAGAVLHPKTNIIGEAVSYIGYPGGGAKKYILSKKEISDTDSLSTCSCILRKEDIQKVGNFNEMLRAGGEDSDLVKRLILKGCRFAYNPFSIVWHKPRESLKEIFWWWFRRGVADAQRGINFKKYFKFLIILSLFFPVIIFFCQISLQILGIIFLSYYLSKLYYSLFVPNFLVAATIPIILLTMKFGREIGALNRIFENKIKKVK